MLTVFKDWVKSTLEEVDYPIKITCAIEVPPQKERELDAIDWLMSW
jgi:hypothetical protein